MDKVAQMVYDIFEDRLDPATLDTIELEQVLDRVQEMAENTVDSDYQESAQLMLAVLAEIVDDRMEATDMSCFDNAITEAEKRGSMYFEFEQYRLH